MKLMFVHHKLDQKLSEVKVVAFEAKMREIKKKIFLIDDSKTLD